MGMASVAICLAVVWLFGFWSQRFLRKQRELHRPHLATVLAVVATGLRDGDLQQMEVTLEIAGDRPRRAQTKQFMASDRLPRLGEVVRVAMQGKALVLLGWSEESDSPAASLPHAPSITTKAPRVIEAVELSPQLRQGGQLAIATILDVRTTASGATRFTLEIDAIHAPKRVIALAQAISEDTYTVGDRAYLLIDAEQAEAMHLLSPSFTGGVKLPREMNRLDPYVLGPELLQHGSRARGVVLEATPVPIGPEMELRGFSRFQLRFRIEPEAGMPAFEAEQTLTLTRPEKIRRMAIPGAVVPIRFDAADPRCFATDSLALGYSDPYAEALALFRDQLKATEA